MRFLLRLKHWQLFLIMWAIPLAVLIVPASRFIFSVIPLFILIYFAWIWAIGTEFHRKLPSGVNLNLTVFKISILLFAAWFIFLEAWSQVGFFSSQRSTEDDVNTNTIIIILTVQIISGVLFILSIRFAAKTFRSVELGKLAKFPVYQYEFNLILFSPLGIWMLQPRLNK